MNSSWNGEYFTSRKLVKKKISVTQTGAGTGEKLPANPESAFAKAARRLQAPEEELMLYIMRMKRPGPGSWSLWENGKRDIPAELLVDFMEERRKKETAAHEGTLAQIYAILDRLSMAFDQNRQGRLLHPRDEAAASLPPPEPSSVSRR